MSGESIAPCAVVFPPSSEDNDTFTLSVDPETKAAQIAEYERILAMPVTRSPNYAYHGWGPDGLPTTLTKEFAAEALSTLKGGKVSNCDACADTSKVYGEKSEYCCPCGVVIGVEPDATATGTKDDSNAWWITPRLYGFRRRAPVSHIVSAITSEIVSGIATSIVTSIVTSIGWTVIDDGFGNTTISSGIVSTIASEITSEITSSISSTIGSTIQTGYVNFYVPPNQTLEAAAVEAANANGDVLTVYEEALIKCGGRVVANEDRCQGIISTSIEVPCVPVGFSSEFLDGTKYTMPRAWLERNYKYYGKHNRFQNTNPSNYIVGTITTVTLSALPSLQTGTAECVVDNSLLRGAYPELFPSHPEFFVPGGFPPPEQTAARGGIGLRDEDRRLIRPLVGAKDPESLPEVVAKPSVVKPTRWTREYYSDDMRDMVEMVRCERPQKCRGSGMTDKTDRMQCVVNAFAYAKKHNLEMVYAIVRVRHVIIQTGTYMAPHGRTAGSKPSVDQDHEYFADYRVQPATCKRGYMHEQLRAARKDEFDEVIRRIGTPMTASTAELKCQKSSAFPRKARPITIPLGKIKSRPMLLETTAIDPESGQEVRRIVQLDTWSDNKLDDLRHMTIGAPSETSAPVPVGKGTKYTTVNTAWGDVRLYDLQSRYWGSEVLAAAAAGPSYKRARLNMMRRSDLTLGGILAAASEGDSYIEFVHAISTGSCPGGDAFPGVEGVPSNREAARQQAQKLAGFSNDPTKLSGFLGDTGELIGDNSKDPTSLAGFKNSASLAGFDSPLTQMLDKKGGKPPVPPNIMLGHDANGNQLVGFDADPVAFGPNTGMVGFDFRPPGSICSF